MTVKLYSGRIYERPAALAEAKANDRAGISTMYERQDFANAMHQISDTKKTTSTFRESTNQDAVSKNLLDRTRDSLAQERDEIAADIRRVRDDPVDVATTPLKLLETSFKSSEFYIKSQVALRAITKSASTIEQLARGG